MQWALIEHLFTKEIIQALTWTFVHSLWQGLVLAIITGLVLVLTKKSTPHLRYNLLIGLFLVFVVTVGFTFSSLLHSATAASGAAGAAFTGVTTGATGNVGAGNTLQNASQKFMDYCNANGPLIITIWFIIFSARFVHLLAGLVYIKRIRHYKVQAPSAQWTELLVALAESMNIRKPVELLESAIVKVPVVVDFLKPVIIVPVGLLSHLSIDQVEAILLHELAHIQRKDYFINLLQSFVEIIFFFNPSLLWISSLIREEREHCCDDMALARIENKSTYIGALVSFQEYNLNIFAARPAVAFAGKKNHLLNRVKRIVYNNNNSLNIFERTFLICSIALLILFSFTFAREIRAGKADQIVSPQKTMKEMSNPQTKPSEVFEVVKDGKKYKIIKTNGKISGFFIDGQSIPVEKIETEYPWMLKAIEQAKLDAKRAGEDQERRKRAEEDRAGKERKKNSIDQDRTEKTQAEEQLRSEQENMKRDRDQEARKREQEQQRQLEEQKRTNPVQ
jgi:beta-lactamase regulating signal transducer with metallopeptidase domain